jgi:hypothetical protein
VRDFHPGLDGIFNNNGKSIVKDSNSIEDCFDSLGDLLIVKFYFEKDCQLWQSAKNMKKLLLTNPN